MSPSLVPARNEDAHSAAAENPRHIALRRAWIAIVTICASFILPPASTRDGRHVDRGSWVSQTTSVRKRWFRQGALVGRAGDMVSETG